MPKLLYIEDSELEAHEIACLPNRVSRILLRWGE